MYLRKNRDYMHLGNKRQYIRLKPTELQNPNQSHALLLRSNTPANGT
jgi:hypothetical protein